MVTYDFTWNVIQSMLLSYTYLKCHEEKTSRKYIYYFENSFNIYDVFVPSPRSVWSLVCRLWVIIGYPLFVITYVIVVLLVFERIRGQARGCDFLYIHCWLQFLSTAECESLCFLHGPRGRTRKPRGSQTQIRGSGTGSTGTDRRRRRDANGSFDTELRASQPPTPGSARGQSWSLWGRVSEAVPRRGLEATIWAPATIQDLRVRLLQGQLNSFFNIIEFITPNYVSNRFPHSIRSSTKPTDPRRAILA